MKVITRCPNHYSVHGFGKWLEEKCRIPEKIADKIVDLLDESFIDRAIQRINKWNYDRQIVVRIDPWDTWGMDTTLAPIILPMLKQLKETKHGAPYINDEDVPEGLGLRSTDPEAEPDEYGLCKNHFAKFDWVLDEMIWAFENVMVDNIELRHMKPRPFEEGEERQPIHGWYSFNKGKPKSEWMKAEYDWDAIKAHDDRIRRGTRLFGSYFRALWD